MRLIAVNDTFKNVLFRLGYLSFIYKKPIYLNTNQFIFPENSGFYRWKNYPMNFGYVYGFGFKLNYI